MGSDLTFYQFSREKVERCDFGPMNMLCDRAQMPEQAIDDRSKAVFEYFDLPFDAEPPLNPAKGHLCH